MKVRFLLYILSYISLTYAYYGSARKPENLSLGIFATTFRMGHDLYSYGGFDMEQNQDATVFGINSNQTLYARDFFPSDLPTFCYFCFGFVMNDSSVLIITGSHLTLYYSGPTGDNITTLYFNPKENTAIETTIPTISPVIPTERIYNQAVITPDNSSVYIFGGMSYFQDALNKKNNEVLSQNLSINLNILKLDIAANTYTNITNFTFVGGTATMLPSGVVVLAFGAYGLTNGSGHFSLYDPSSVFLFDTKTNTLRTQKTTGILPSARAEASGTLGSEFDVTTSDSNNPKQNHWIIVRSKLYSDVVVLNTTSWTWFSPNITGPPSDARYGHFSLLYENNSLIIGGGSTRYKRLDDISMLRNLPVLGQSIEAAQLQWFSNSPADYAYSETESITPKTLSVGAIVGISVSCLVVFIITLYFVWRKFPRFRKILYTIHHKLIWNPRYGEPFWTEVLRVFIRFILIGAFLAFTIYVIIRAVNSPNISQEQVEEWEEMPVPDIRICSDAAVGLNITCEFTNGEDCSEYIHELDFDYLPKDEGVGCYIFIPPTNLYFKSSNGSYGANLRDGMYIRLYRPHGIDTVETIYYTYYTFQYDPFRKLLGIMDNVSMLSYDKAMKMYTSESMIFPSPTTFITGVDTSVLTAFTLTESSVLTSNNWNAIGFAYDYDTTLEAIQNIGPKIPLGNSTGTTWKPISLLKVKPAVYELRIIKEQRVSTILGGLAQAGGVFSLFIAVQALLFGFRPDSPWGVVHRWTFGNQRRTLTSHLTHQFDNLKTSVPMVTPVHSRFYSTNGKNSISTFDSISANDLEIQENKDEKARLQRMEDRLQLMETLFKTYYINDEIFYQLNEARKERNDNNDGLNSISDRSDEETLMK